jgi:hypothetical protein
VKAAVSNHNRSIQDTMSIYRPPVPVNSTGAGEREREFLTKAINTAIARARLTVNTLEAIAAALRHKQATIDEIRDWLKDEGLEQHVLRYMRGGQS